MESKRNETQNENCYSYPTDSWNIFTLWRDFCLQLGDVHLYRESSRRRVQIISDDSYATDILDGGVRVANIHIRAEHPAPQALDVPVLVSIWHSEETELDSLFLRFSGTDYIQVYLEVPGVLGRRFISIRPVMAKELSSKLMI